jgi:hypothetical protein
MLLERYQFRIVTLDKQLIRGGEAEVYKNLQKRKPKYLEIDRDGSNFG